MNKQELIAAVLANKEAGIETKAAAERAVNAVLDALTEGLKGDGVQLIGFGSFKAKYRSGRDGRNPLTGAKIKIKESWSVNFKAGASLKEAVAKAQKAAAKKKAAPKAPAAKKAPAKKKK